MTAVSVPKPFLELSILEYTSPEHNLKQYKYIHALVQELHLKIELGFINALSELFEEEEILEENTAEKLEQDLNHARKELKDHAILTVSQVKMSVKFVIRTCDWSVPTKFVLCRI